MKKSFLLYANYLQQIEMLSMEQRGELLTALLQYASGCPAEECCDGYDGMVRMAFSFIRAQIDRDTAEYEKKCNKLRENAKKRWEAAAEKKDSNKNAKASKRMQLHTNAKNAMHNDNDYDNEKENTHRVSIKENANAHTPSDPKSAGEDNDVFTPPTPDEVRTYAAEYGGQIDAERFVNYYQSINWMVGNNQITDWKAAARNWMNSQAPPRPKQGTIINRFQNFKQREVDYDAIVADLARG